MVSNERRDPIELVKQADNAAILRIYDTGRYDGWQEGNKAGLREPRLIPTLTICVFMGLTGWFSGFIVWGALHSPPPCVEEIKD